MLSHTKDKNLVGIAGVHHVVSELSRRGMVALATIKNLAAYDLLASNQDGTKHANIQVKTSSRRVTFWPVGKSSKVKEGPRDYFVFLRWLEEEEKYEGFLVTGKEVRRNVAAGERLKRRRGAKGLSSFAFRRAGTTAATRWHKKWEDWRL